MISPRAHLGGSSDVKSEASSADLDAAKLQSMAAGSVGTFQLVVDLHNQGLVDKHTTMRFMDNYRFLGSSLHTLYRHLDSNLHATRRTSAVWMALRVSYPKNSRGAASLGSISREHRVRLQHKEFSSCRRRLATPVFSTGGRRTWTTSTKTALPSTARWSLESMTAIGCEFGILLMGWRICGYRSWP